MFKAECSAIEWEASMSGGKCTKTWQLVVKKGAFSICLQFSFVISCVLSAKVPEQQYGPIGELFAGNAPML